MGLLVLADCIHVGLPRTENHGTEVRCLFSAFCLVLSTEPEVGHGVPRPS